MATPSSDVEQAALKNYGAGKGYTPNTPETPNAAAAAAAGALPPRLSGSSGPGPSPFAAQQQQRRGVTLADIRRRNLDEQQALRDEGHLKRYRVRKRRLLACLLCLLKVLLLDGGLGSFGRQPVCFV